MGNCARTIQKNHSLNDNIQSADSYKRTTTGISTNVDNNPDSFEDISPSKIYKRGSVRKSKSGADTTQITKEEDILGKGNLSLARCNSIEEKCERKREKGEEIGKFSGPEGYFEVVRPYVNDGEKNVHNEHSSNENNRVQKYEPNIEIQRNSLNLYNSVNSQAESKNKANFYNNQTPLPTVMELSIEQMESVMYRSGTNRSSIKSIAKNEEIYLRQNNFTTNFHQNQPNVMIIKSK